MAKKDLQSLFDKIIIEIADEGKSLRDAVKGKMSINAFYEILKDDNSVKRYARACEERADKIADEILEIADNGSNKDNTIVQRDRLRIDSRKWLLAKLHPKKYGDRIDVTSGNAPLNPPTVIFKDFKNE